ncbi:MAG: hypothetical protein IJK50_09520 [Prevotella sp.]|nr:hypothetical protein [Prevotella sp.]
MNEQLSQNSIKVSQVYDGGSLNPIKAEDLRGNIVAIRQLINNFNSNVQRLEEIEHELQKTKSELEYQNTYPYIAIFTSAINVAGTILVGIGVNLQTSPSGKNSTVLIGIGGLLVLVSNLFVIFYKKIRQWSNR